ncbi:ATP-binding protein [Paraburkholderia bannensis]|uniref:ATP-binding protein n=1 Tax=Paraburkholderia bannensis TaxID=765414 RepID=UPI002AB6F579|nr:winged helix-turn-helix domain-containing protein [Paraburkholderia bannensis]
MVKIGALRINFEQREMRRDGRALRISARAFDILDVLYRANGAIVSKDDIIEAVWPRQVVEENRLQVQIAALRKAFGEDRELIKTVTGRGYLLVKRVAASPGDQSDQGEQGEQCGEPRAGADLPFYATPLIGRDDEVARLLAQLEQAAVLTLAGAGGVGKTALAVRVAQAVGDTTARTVRFVELASAPTREAVLAALALAWRIGPDAIGDEARVLAAIRDAVPPEGALLVLDNAEHVIDIVAALAETLAASSALRVLVTSREPLSIRAETLFRVEPLAVPPEDASTPTMLAHGAVALFLQRARRHAPACGNDAASIRLVADICRRLDGLPLAIELAAARVATLGIEGVAVRLRDSLDDRLDLLSGGPRDASPRQQTLRATFDWSYALLDANAQALLRNLAFFAGAFTFEAVCAVAAEPDEPVAAVIASLGELIAKSLLAVEFRGAIALYRLTESTRAYAMSKLREEGALRRVGERHLRYLQPHIEDRALLAPTRTLARTRPSLDDARRAWDWAFSPEGDAVLGVALAGSLVGTLLDAGLVHECHERAARALAALDSLPPEAAKSVDALCEMRLRAAFAATVLLTGGLAADSAMHWRAVLKRAQASGDEAFAARALWGLWNAAMTAGDIHASLRFATRLEVSAARAGTAWQKLCASAMLAASLHCFGEHGQARERLEHTLAAIDALHADGPPPRVDSDLAVDPRIFGTGTLARIAWLEGDPVLALQLTQRALNHVRADMLEPTLCHLLAVVVVPLKLACGDLAEAKRHLALLRSQAALHRFDGWQAYGECLAGQIDLQTGREEQGLARLEAGLAQLASRDFRRLVAPLEATCAQALAAAGRIDDALNMLEAARRHGDLHGDSGFAAELQRVRGVVELARAQRLAHVSRAGKAGAARYVEAGRRALHDAMQLAHEQGARLLALRAALDLAASLAQDGAADEAAALLAPFESFVEHRSVPEAQRLAVLLASLRNRVTRCDSFNAVD